MSVEIKGLLNGPVKSTYKKQERNAMLRVGSLGIVVKDVTRDRETFVRFSRDAGVPSERLRAAAAVANAIICDVPIDLLVERLGATDAETLRRLLGRAATPGRVHGG